MKRWLRTPGCASIACYRKCGECPVRFRCYTLELVRDLWGGLHRDTNRLTPVRLEVTPEERAIIRSLNIPEGVI